jgi:hypothetical protein
MYLADTFPDNRGSFNTVDTGDSYDHSQYINFNYQFNATDSVVLKGTVTVPGTDSTYDTIYKCAPRPGYAGFKLYWDHGLVNFNATAHDSMCFWHKGPLAGHKVKLIWAQGGECGGAINYEYFGQFTSSNTWKRECLPFPQLRGNFPQNPSPDSPFVKKGLFELRVLIYDDSSVTTLPTSGPGNLKLDNICFIKKNTGVNNPINASKAVAASSRCFTPLASGKVTLAIYSLQGEQLYKGLVDVSKGKSYDVAQFARTNSKLSAELIRCVQISGSGLNITAKLYR